MHRSTHTHCKELVQALLKRQFSPGKGELAEIFCHRKHGGVSSQDKLQDTGYEETASHCGTKHSTLTECDRYRLLVHHEAPTLSRHIRTILSPRAETRENTHRPPVLSYWVLFQVSQLSTTRPLPLTTRLPAQHPAEGLQWHGTVTTTIQPATARHSHPELACPWVGICSTGKVVRDDTQLAASITL